jgi:EAL domain-containing protein (putative c-di-GMP-specific phosphodiesterase class I)
VETVDQLDFLREHSCDRFQGFLVSPALTADNCLALIRSRL